MKILDDILYTEYVEIIEEQDRKQRFLKVMTAFCDDPSDLGKLTKEELEKANVAISQKLDAIKEIKLSRVDETIMLLMTFGMSYSDAIKVPARIGMAFMKQQSNIRVKNLEKQKEDLEKFETLNKLNQEKKTKEHIKSVELFNTSALKNLEKANKRVEKK
jgi:hypothetical protein